MTDELTAAERQALTMARHTLRTVWGSSAEAPRFRREYLPDLETALDKVLAATQPNCGLGHDVSRISCEDAARAIASRSTDSGSYDRKPGHDG
jgi:hypothetical protein